MAYEKAPKRDVLVSYGPRGLVEKFGGVKGTKGTVLEAVWVFDYNDTPAWEDTRLSAIIPAGSVIKAARLEILETATGLTDLDAVLEKASDGTNPEVLFANVTATSGSVAAAGALVGTVLTEDKVLDVAITGASAGKFRLVLEYTL